MTERMLRTGLLTVMVAGFTVGGLAPPAWAHATFAGPSQYPADTDQRLTMDVPFERAEGVFNVKVDVEVPAGWRALGCESPTGWTCQVAGSVVRWQKQGAEEGPDDQTFNFTVHTGSPGAVAFRTVQTYSNGEVARWIGPPDSEAPAPIIEAVAGTPVTTEPPVVTEPTSPPTTTGTTRTTVPPTTVPAATTTVVPEESTTVVPVEETTLPAPEESTTTTASTLPKAAAPIVKPAASSSSKAGLLIVLAILAGAGAVGGVMMRRRRQP